MDLYNELSNKEPAPLEMPVEKKSSVGAVIGTVIVILLLILGALYFWGARLNEKSDNPPPYILGAESSGESDTAAGLPPQGSSDEAADIDADIQAMNMSQFEAETQNSQAAFNAEAQ